MHIFEDSDLSSAQFEHFACFWYFERFNVLKFHKLITLGSQVEIRFRPVKTNSDFIQRVLSAKKVTMAITQDLGLS